MLTETLRIVHNSAANILQRNGERIAMILKLRIIVATEGSIQDGIALSPSEHLSKLTIVTEFIFWSHPGHFKYVAS